jgi:hypothetical protein
LLTSHTILGAITPSRTDDAYVKTLFPSNAINFVWASKGTLKSMNSASMVAGPVRYSTGMSKSIELKANLAVCNNGKCLHDAVIIQTPWDPDNYDTARDYTLFTVNGKEVQSDYLKVTETLLLNTINT